MICHKRSLWRLLNIHRSAFTNNQLSQHLNIDSSDAQPYLLLCSSHTSLFIHPTPSPSSPPLHLPFSHPRFPSQLHSKWITSPMDHAQKSFTPLSLCLFLHYLLFGFNSPHTHTCMHTHARQILWGGMIKGGAISSMDNFQDGLL